MIRLFTIPVLCVLLGCGEDDARIAEGGSETSELGPREASLEREGCGPGDTTRVDGMEQVLDVQDEESWSVVSYIEPCGATSVGTPGENLVFDLGEEGSSPTGRLYFGTRSPIDSRALRELWMFAFVGDREVTDVVFGDANLFVLPADGSAYSTEIAIPSEIASRGGVVSVLFVDRLFATDRSDGRHHHFNRMFVNGTEEAVFPPSVQRVPSVSDGIDPFPQPVRFEDDRRDASTGGAFLTFARGLGTRGNPTTEVSVFPFDPTTGERTGMACEDDSQGWIVTSTPPDAPAGMSCSLGEDRSGKETAAVVLYDQFVVDPATGSAYVSIYPQSTMAYLDVRDQITGANVADLD